MRFSTEAIVLRRTDYGEGDRIINILTAEHGKLSAIAKGARKPKSKLAGGIEPFSLVNVTLLRGRTDLHTLVSSQMAQNFDHITTDYERLTLGYVILKKINQAAETLHESALYELLKLSLISVNALTIDVRLSETWFHAHYLQVLGHGLNIVTDGNGKKLDAALLYNFSVADMAFFEHPKGTYGGDHLKLLKVLLARTPDFAASIRGVDMVVEDCLRLLRTIDE